MLKDFIENLRDGNKLKDYVIDYYLDEIEDNDVDKLLGSMEDLQKYGCVSGMIGSLIYYDDTNNFYNTYKEEINELIRDLSIDTDLSMSELFRKNFDNEDQLVLECHNKNLLAWTGFEQTAYQLYNKIYDYFKNNNYEFNY